MGVPARTSDHSQWLYAVFDTDKPTNDARTFYYFVDVAHIFFFYTILNHAQHLGDFFYCLNVLESSRFEKKKKYREDPLFSISFRLRFVHRTASMCAIAQIVDRAISSVLHKNRAESNWTETSACNEYAMDARTKPQASDSERLFFFYFFFSGAP